MLHSLLKNRKNGYARRDDGSQVLILGSRKALNRGSDERFGDDFLLRMLSQTPVVQPM